MSRTSSKIMVFSVLLDNANHQHYPATIWGLQCHANVQQFLLFKRKNLIQRTRDTIEKRQRSRAAARGPGGVEKKEPSQHQERKNPRHDQT